MTPITNRITISPPQPKPDNFKYFFTVVTSPLEKSAPKSSLNRRSFVIPCVGLSEPCLKPTAQGQGRHQPRRLVACFAGSRRVVASPVPFHRVLLRITATNRQKRAIWRIKLFPNLQLSNGWWTDSISSRLPLRFDKCSGPFLSMPPNPPKSHSEAYSSK